MYSIAIEEAPARRRRCGSGTRAAAGAVELQVELTATLAVNESPRLKARCTSQQTTPQQRKQDTV